MTVPQTRLILSLMLMLQIVATMQVFLEPSSITGGVERHHQRGLPIYHYAFTNNNSATPRRSVSCCCWC